MCLNRQWKYILPDFKCFNVASNLEVLVEFECMQSDSPPL